MKSQHHFKKYTLSLFIKSIICILLVFIGDLCFAQPSLSLAKLDTLAKQVAVIEIQHDYLQSVAGHIYRLNTEMVVDKIDAGYLKTLPEFIACIEDTNGRLWGHFKVYRYFQFNIDHPSSKHLVLDTNGGVFFLEVLKGKSFNHFSKNMIKRIKSKEEATDLAMLYNSTINYSDDKREVITETNLSTYKKLFNGIHPIITKEMNHKYNIKMFTVDTLIIDANTAREEIRECIFRISKDAQVEYQSKILNVRKIPPPIWKPYKK